MALLVAKAIVLEIIEKSENEFYVTFFNDKGVLILFAQGLNKQLSKNRSNLQIGSLVEIEYFSARLKGRIGRLKRVNLLHIFSITSSDTNIFLLKLIKLFKNLKIPNHIFNFYTLNMDKFKKDNLKKYLCVFYAQSSVYFGVKPSFNKCRICHQRKNLVDFSILEGGFICSNHNLNDTKNQEQLLLYWYLYYQPEKYVKLVSQTENILLLNQLKHIISEAGYYL
ncbi:DNA repair protein RecO [Mycoplasma sp. 4013]